MLLPLPLLLEPNIWFTLVWDWVPDALRLHNWDVNFHLYVVFCHLYGKNDPPRHSKGGAWHLISQLHWCVEYCLPASFSELHMFLQAHWRPPVSLTLVLMRNGWKMWIRINISHPAHKTGSNIKSELRQTNPLWQSDTEEENKYKHSKFAFPGFWLNPYAALTFFMLGCRACNLLVMFHSRPALFVVCHIFEKHIQVIILFQTLNPTQLCRQSNIISNCESHHIQYYISLWFEMDSHSTSGAACKLKQRLRGIWK